MQTYLEKQGIESRNAQSVNNDYIKSDEYSAIHKDAISDGDSRGKGTGFGGHTHVIPNHNKSKAIDYSTFSVGDGGNIYDIEGRNGNGGRNFLQTISLYNEEMEYGAHMIDTSANKADGQIII